MFLNLSKINSVADCNEILSHLNFQKLNYEYKKAGLDLRAEKYLNIYNTLKQLIATIKSDINALEMALEVLPEGNIKNQLGLQKIKTEHKLFLLVERLAKMDITKVLIYQSRSSEFGSMITVCEESMALVADHKNFLNALSGLEFVDFPSVKPPSLLPDFFEEVSKQALAASSNAHFLKSTPLPSNENNNSELQVLFKKHIKSESRDFVYFQ